jgi:hypothetical protein
VVVRAGRHNLGEEDIRGILSIYPFLAGSTDRAATVHVWAFAGGTGSAALHLGRQRRFLAWSEITFNDSLAQKVQRRQEVERRSCAQIFPCIAIYRLGSQVFSNLAERARTVISMLAHALLALAAREGPGAVLQPSAWTRSTTLH